MNVQMRIITDENVNQVLSLSYSDNVNKLLKDNRDLPSVMSKYVVELQKVLNETKYTKPDIAEPELPVETQVVPESPPYAPSSPAYNTESPPYAPGSPAYNPESPPYAPGYPAYNPESPPYAPESPPYAPGSPAYNQNENSQPISPTYPPESGSNSPVLEEEKSDVKPEIKKDSIETNTILDIDNNTSDEKALEKEEKSSDVKIIKLPDKTTL
jgi:hypothetical protein